MTLSDQIDFVSVEQIRGDYPRTDGVAGVVGAISAAETIKLARRSGFKLEADGDDVAFEGPDAPSSHAILDALRKRKEEVVALLREQRREVIRHIADNFRSSEPGRCIHCGGDSRPDEQFVTIFVGDDRADIHAACHSKWFSRQESDARAALGIEPLEKEGRHAS